MLTILDMECLYSSIRFPLVFPHGRSLLAIILGNYQEAFMNSLLFSAWLRKAEVMIQNQTRLFVALSNVWLLCIEERLVLLPTPIRRCPRPKPHAPRNRCKDDFEPTLLRQA